jgi:hypothetical protein
MTSEPNIVLEAAKWGWVALVGVVVWMWQRLTGRVDDTAEALSDHIMDDLKMHDDFVTHDYMQAEIKPWLNRIDSKMDTLVTQTADVIKRDEYKADITALHNKIEAVKDSMHK